MRQTIYDAVLIPDGDGGHSIVKLRFGLGIPDGWADGLTYSPESAVACEVLMGPIEGTGAAGMMRCIVQVPGHGGSTASDNLQ